MSQEEKFSQLQNEIALYKPLMKQASDTVRDQDVSEYPIFVFHQQEVAIGINVVDKNKVQGNWSVNVSTLEEFVSKNLILDENVESFKKKFGTDEENYCLFVLSELGADFIFMPRNQTEEPKK